MVYIYVVYIYIYMVYIFIYCIYIYTYILSGYFYGMRNINHKWGDLLLITGITRAIYIIWRFRQKLSIISMIYGIYL